MMYLSVDLCLFSVAVDCDKDPGADDQTEELNRQQHQLDCRCFFAGVECFCFLLGLAEELLCRSCASADFVSCVFYCCFFPHSAQ